MTFTTQFNENTDTQINETKWDEESLIDAIHKAFIKTVIIDHGEFENGMFSVELDSRGPMITVLAKELDALTKKGIVMTGFRVFGDRLFMEFKVKG